MSPLKICGRYPIPLEIALLGPHLTLIRFAITSWSTQALMTVGSELPFMGWRFTAIRWGLGLAVPFLAGVATSLFFWLRSTRGSAGKTYTAEEADCQSV